MAERESADVDYSLISSMCSFVSNSSTYCQSERGGVTFILQAVVSVRCDDDDDRTDAGQENAGTHLRPVNFSPSPLAHLGADNGKLGNHHCATVCAVSPPLFTLLNQL